MKLFEFAERPQVVKETPKPKTTGVIMYNKNSTSTKATLSKAEQIEQEQKLKKYRQLIKQQASEFDEN